MMHQYIDVSLHPSYFYVGQQYVKWSDAKKNEELTGHIGATEFKG